MNLAERRADRGVSQQWLADQAGVVRSAIANYESGFRSPSALLMRTLAEILEITMDEYQSSWEES